MGIKLVIGAAVVAGAAFVFWNNRGDEVAVPSVAVPAGAAAPPVLTHVVEDTDGVAENPSVRAGETERVSAPPQATIDQQSTERCLRIQTLDHTGAPISGVQVGVLVRAPRQDYGEWVGVTEGVQGLARMDAFDRRIERELLPGCEVYAYLDVALSDKVEAWVDTENFPEQPVVLTLPPTGQLHVRLEDASGNPWTERGYVEVYPWVPDTTDPRGERRCERVIVQGEGPEVDLAHVELGLRLQVRLVESETYLSVEKSIPGPSYPGETVAVTLRMVGDRHRIRGRLLDPAGQPVVRERVGLGFDDAAGVDLSAASDPVTDSEGRFTFQIVSSRPSLTLQGAEIRVDEGHGAKLHVALGSLETRLGETLDLGDLHAGLLPLVADGRVVDGKGEPLYWATVRIQQKVDSLGYPIDSGDTDNLQDFRWYWVNDFQVQTDHQGRFEVRGQAPSPHLSFIASKTGYLDSQRTEFVPGTTDVLLVLPEEGLLAGSLRLGEGIPASWFSIEVEPKDRESLTVWHRGGQFKPAGRPDNAGRFVVSGLPPGHADVRIVLAGVLKPVFEARNVRIVGGEECRDPRLQNIDLTEAVRLVRIEVEGSPGAPAPEGVVLIHGPHADPSPYFVTFSGGLVSLLAPPGGLDLTLFAYGYRSHRLSAVRGNVHVKLEPGLPVRVRLPQALPLPTSPCDLELQAALEGDGFGQVPLHGEDGAQVAGPIWRRPGFYIAFKGARTVQLTLPEEGRYRLRWRITGREGDPREVRASTLEESYLDVSQAMAPFEIVRGPDPDDYSKELSEGCDSQ